MQNNDQMHNDQNDLENIYSFIPSGEFYFSKGIQAFQKHDLQNAKKYLRRAMELEPNEPIIACQYAIVLGELELYEQSNDIIYHVLNEIDPDLHECHYFLANNFAYMGLYKKSLYHANKYISLEPDGQFAKDALELIEIVSIENEEEHVDPISSNDFEDEELIEGQEEAMHLLENGKYDEAIEEFQQLITKHPDFWPAHNNLALAYYYVGKKDLAKEVTERVLAKSPGNLHALCNMVVFLYYDGEDYQSLLPALEKIHPISIDHRYKLGVTFSILGEYEKGYYWLRKIMKHIPVDDGSFYYWYSCAAYYVGKKQQADFAWKNLLKYHPDKIGMEPWK
ncbi:tetratricopeptide repeat protein [Fervidibacillus halotolerans]|uniref:Tetratricopeptide repeat protein n=1 Tax=Fervidibacillus halotolerans TaxID=2980027 RepID=A0A9E8RWN9_9BACI|nr:tetratricopeptide repeat protein [Fervidibacillus halotolerans]WAA11955.1 tetratricopeptide repeat protein [Fervidibacillus halotolerans]